MIDNDKLKEIFKKDKNQTYKVLRKLSKENPSHIKTRKLKVK